MMFSTISKSFLLLAALGVFERVNAHGRIVTWTVTGNGKTTAEPGEDYDGKDMALTAQRRKPKGLLIADGYVNVTNIPEIACWSKETTAERSYPIDAGSIVTTQWSHTANGPVTDFWPSGHGGPIIEYMAACPDSGCDGVDAMTAPWFKISESILYNGEWASNKVMKDGKWDFKIPAELKKGHYLLRHEILSVHGVEGTPQSYPFCIQMELIGTGTAVPDKTYTFPGIYNDFSQSYMQYQIKADEVDGPVPARPFVAPGPPVWNAQGGSSGDEAQASSVGGPEASASVTDIQAGASAGPSTSASAQAGNDLVGSASTYAAPTASISINDFSQKGVVQGDGNSGADVTIDKTLPSASTSAQAAASTSQSQSYSATDAAPADTTATSGGSEYVSDVAGGACIAPRWQCSTKDGKTTLQVCNKNEQNVYVWQPSNDCPTHCFDSDPLLPDCQ